MTNTFSPNLLEQLGAISSALSIDSPESFTFAGKRFDVAVHTHQQAAAGYGSASNPLIAALQWCFYNNCYSQDFRGKVREDVPIQAASSDLSTQLSSANVGQSRWDAGWQIVRLEQSGQITAQKSGASRTLWPGEFLTHDGPGVPPRVGSQVSVFFPKESKTMQPGFYFAFGELDADFSSDTRLVRFYWNITEQGAVPLTRWVTQTLNRYQLPFRFKCLTQSAQYQRTDSAVLYVNKKYFRFAAELVAGGCDQVASFMRSETPLFSRTLAPGLGLAEDPANGESFGMNRCRVLAEGIYKAHEKRFLSEQQKLDEIAGCFLSYGLDLQRPHLNAGSADFYDTPAFPA